MKFYTIMKNQDPLCPNIAKSNINLRINLVSGLVWEVGVYFDEYASIFFRLLRYEFVNEDCVPSC